MAPPTKKPIGSKLLKSINQQKVLRIIFTHGSVSRVQLSELTGLTQQTITNIVNRLLDEGLLKEKHPIASNSGRRPIPLVIQSEKLLAIGIEISVTYIKGTLMNFNRHIIKEIEIEVSEYQDEEGTIEYARQVIDQLLEHVPEHAKLNGIGCSIQGLVDSKQGIVLYSSGLRWRNFPLKKRLEEEYDIPVYLENDVNLLALAENLNGRLSDSQNNVTIKLDTGVGGAIVFNKQLHAGSNHVAGEIGHYKSFMGKEAYDCHCGGRGCLTTLASVSGLKHNAGYSVEQLRDLYEKRDPHAVQLYTSVETSVTMAISNIITLLNPDHVLLTGMMFDVLGEPFLSAIQKSVMHTIPETCRKVNIICLPKTPTESASAVGLVMNHFYDVPLDTLVQGI
ncbi:ROK family protein [Paenibacillus sp. HJGM_3]|uniref:ROK family protein n=1 Tax=Paenibacillus sp. HJGM_3 TaxID=3379816 RepID=UPI00385D1142